VNPEILLAGLIGGTMASGTITYIAPIESVRLLAPIKVSHPHWKVEKIVVETQGSEQIKVVFHLTDVFTDTDAKDIAKNILDSVLARIAFELDRSIGHPYMKGFTLPKDATGSSYTAQSSVRALWSVAAATITLSDESLQELARSLEQPSARPDLYSAYRFAVSQSDPVARFMFLYNIMLALHNDKQPQVDSFICGKVPKVPQRLNPKGRMETVYTCLRNEVGHARGTPPKRTREEIQENLAAFQKLVKTAIAKTS
jgi:hypothetical protein